jgi:hypothetical protein
MEAAETGETREMWHLAVIKRGEMFVGNCPESVPGDY